MFSLLSWLRLRPIFLLFWMCGLCSPVGARANRVNSVGKVMPPDAAPLDEQVFRAFDLDGTYMEWFKTVYKRTAGTVLIGEPLLRMNRNFDLIPGAAERWEASPDGLTWTFHLRRGMVWSDGRPLTAHDYAYTYRRAADPDNAYDFEWFFRPIKNWSDVVGRRKPVSALGVQAIDDYTFAVTTETPAPYLPMLLQQSWPSPKQAIDKYGDAWSTSPETSVSSGPFLLKEWRRNDLLILAANPHYRGPEKPYLEQIIYRLYTPMAMPQILATYEANEIDFAAIAGQAALGRVKSDPYLRSQLHEFVDYITMYLTMDTYHSVFKDVRVRRAFAHAIDRNALMKSVLRDIAVPASSMLAPGFPAAASEQLRPLQDYNPPFARRLLAEAGYPDGRGFPAVELWVRNRESEQMRSAAEAIQAMISQTLHVQLEVRIIESKTFMDALNTHRLPLALLPYSYDYYDASNLMTLWLSNGRHAWKNDLFERLVGQANQFMGPWVERERMYREAERLLVSDVGGIFLWHPVTSQVWKPYLKGEELIPNREGLLAWRGGRQEVTVYVTNDRHGRSSRFSLLAWLRRMFLPTTD